jgi:hypothetical protein
MEAYRAVFGLALLPALGGCSSKQRHDCAFDELFLPLRGYKHMANVDCRWCAQVI